MKRLSKVPVNHRILLHLRTCHKYRDRFEVPFALTQLGIAESVIIHRAAAARSLNEMKEKNFIHSETKHVVRGNRKRKVYFLTDEGLKAAQEIEQHLLESSISVTGKGSHQKRDVLLGQLVSKKLEGISLLTACNHLHGGVLDLDFLEQGGSEAGVDSSGERLSRPGRVAHVPDIPHISHFTGREKELDRIRQLVNGGRVSGIVVQGLAGIGKTSLAACVAHWFKERREVFWLTIHEWTLFPSFATRLLDFLLDRPEGAGEHRGRIDDGSDDSGFGEVLDRAQGALRKRKVLMVLDDIHNANTTILNFMRALLHSMKNVQDAAFLMTSRTMPNFYDRRLVAVEKQIAELTLSGLGFDESFELVNTLRLKKQDHALASLESPGTPLLEPLGTRRGVPGDSRDARA